MSIEDIDYLYKNSVKDNAVIFVDSSKRDKLTFPDPNSYTITFDEPFKYVYGIEILDASIPRSMYQIDENNNKLEVVIGDATQQNASISSNYNSSNTALKKITLNFDPQDLELDDLANKLTDLLKSNPLSTNNDKSIFVRTVSSPSSEISKLIFYSGIEPDSDGVILDSTVFYILGATSTLTDNLGFSENAIDNNRGSNSTIHDYNRITETEARVLYEISQSDWDSYTTEQKNFYINNTFKSGDNNIGDLNKYNLGKNPSLESPDYDNEFPDLDNINNNNNNNVHRIQTPGIVNLVGERFITLRSDTIEKHLSSFYSGSNSIGIGLFKLGFSGYVDARFDFSSVKYKDLHPIGKLSSIDLRFERIDGELYNFRGLNHHMLISIKYLVPYKKPEKFDYTLNTNYNPDLLEYKRTQYEKDDNSDEEINELANNFKKNFLEKEKEYEYSSDEDLEYVDERNELSDSESSIDESSDYDSNDDNNHNLTPYNRFYKYS